MISLPTWDLVIILFFILAIGYGIILGRDKVLVTLIATYIGFVVAHEFGNTVYGILTGESLFGSSYWIKTNLSVFLIKTALFIISIVLLSSKGGFSSAGGGSGLKVGILTGIFSLLNAGLIVSSLIWFLTEESRKALFSQSHLASWIAGARNWWLILPLILMVTAGFLASKEE